MKVIHTNDINKQVLIDLFIDNWGDDEMVVSTETYQLSDLPGFVADIMKQTKYLANQLKQVLFNIIKKF